MSGQELCILGWRYQFGIDIEKDLAKAFECYMQAANSGEGEGMFQVAEFYHLDIHVEMSRSKAFEYFLKSAESGFRMGIHKTYLYNYKTRIYHLDRLYHLDRDSQYLKNEKCPNCQNYNTYYNWCFDCEPDLTIQKWTSKNRKIDSFLKRFQIEIEYYSGMIEWIPFDRLKNIVIIGRGGFSTVFKATWSDGTRKSDSSRVPEKIVALKTLNDLQEFANHAKCYLNYSYLKIYGLTQNNETNEYLMVFIYASNGNLNDYLRNNWNKLKWKNKIEILKYISDDLRNIHRANLIHADLHSGNILQHHLTTFISDLGQTRKVNEEKGKIYGVLPYIAPEVLWGKKFTQAADIYGFGIIMWELTTGQRPFDGYEFDIGLALRICNGLRPEFDEYVPECYVELASQCMDSDPEKRPTAGVIKDKIRQWKNSVGILKKFEEADKHKPQFFEQRPKNIYTSRLINTREISMKMSAELYL